MAHNDPRRRLPPSQIPGHQLYPLLSQLTPLPNLAHIKHETPGGIPGVPKVIFLQAPEFNGK